MTTETLVTVYVLGFIVTLIIALIVLAGESHEKLDILLALLICALWPVVPVLAILVALYSVTISFLKKL